MSSIVFQPIGIVRSPFTEQSGTPIQSALAGDAKGWLEIDSAFTEALRDLGEFDRVWVLYHLDRTSPYTPLVTPYLDTVAHGLFATRSPARPNPIGLSVLRILSIDGARIEVAGLDILDGTPILDIKPYVPAFDAIADSRAGWFDRVKRGEDTVRADGRFEREP